MISTKEHSDVINCLVLFNSVHDVIKAEKLIKAKGYDYQIVPVPSNISSECGMCIEINNERSIEVSSLLEKNQVKHQISIK